MDSRIIDALRAHPGIDDWTLRLERTRGVQIYLVGNDIESVRRVSREAYEVEVFNDHPAPVGGAGEHDQVRGSATVPLARVDLGRLTSVLDDAVTMAKLINNPPWPLAGPFPPRRWPSPIIDWSTPRTRPRPASRQPTRSASWPNASDPRGCD